MSEASMIPRHQPGGPPRGSLTSSPRQAPTYRRLASDTLREMILSGMAQPGERLVEAQVAERLGISKTPVREAFAALHEEGLVEMVPYRGAVVRWLSIAELLEQRYLLDALELPSLPLVIQRISDEQLDRLDSLLDVVRQARYGIDAARLATAATRIQRLLLAATGLHRLTTLTGMVVGPIGERYDRLLVYPYPDSWQLAVALVLERHEAIRRRDADRACTVVTLHRDAILRLALSRADTPRVRPYFRER